MGNLRERKFVDSDQDFSVTVESFSPLKPRIWGRVAQSPSRALEPLSLPPDSRTVLGNGLHDLRKKIGGIAFQGFSDQDKFENIHSALQQLDLIHV